MTLKLALMIAGAVICIETVGLMVVGLRRPLVVGLSNSGPEILQSINDLEISGTQIRAFIFEVLNLKFPAQPTVDKIRRVCPLFSEGLKSACEKELSDKKSVIPQDFKIEGIGLG